MIQGLGEQTAYLYIPRDATLFGYAQVFEGDVEYYFDEMVKGVVGSEPGIDGWPPDDKIFSPFVPISATGQVDDVIFRDDVIGQAEIREAELLIQRSDAPADWDPVIVVRILRKRDQSRGIPTKVEVEVEVEPEARTSEPSPPKYDRKKVAKAAVKQFVDRVVGMVDFRSREERSDLYQGIYNVFIKLDGVNQEGAEIDQLKNRVVIADRLRKALVAIENRDDRLVYLRRWMKEHPNGC
jgi:hypothetical protein